MSAPPAEEIERTCGIARAMARRRYRGHHAVDDIAQDAAVAVLESLATYDPGAGSLVTYGVNASRWRAQRRYQKELAHETCRSVHEVANNAGDKFPPRRRRLLDHAPSKGSDGVTDLHELVGDREAVDVEAEMIEREWGEYVMKCYHWELRAYARRTTSDRVAAVCRALISGGIGAGVTFREIATEVGCTYQNVGQIHLRAANRVRARIATEGERA